MAKSYPHHWKNKQRGPNDRQHARSYHDRQDRAQEEALAKLVSGRRRPKKVSRRQKDLQVLASLPQGAIHVYTDGCYAWSSRTGGWGAILKQGTSAVEIKGGMDNTTCQRAEIEAVIQALRLIDRPSQVVIYSDSRYVVDTLGKGWLKAWVQSGRLYGLNGKKAVCNSDLWKIVLNLTKDHKVTTLWVKGHRDHAENCRCDELAEMGRLEFLADKNQKH